MGHARGNAERSAARLVPQLAAAIAAARAETDALFARVRPEALLDRPIPERHRLLFYVGHLEAFDWNLVGTRVFERDPADPQLDRLFAFGIDPIGGGLPADAPGDWPAIEEVRAYVRRARERLDACLAEPTWPDRAAPLPPDGSVLHVALEHRLMHAETLAYQLRALPDGRKLAPSQRTQPAPLARARSAPPHAVEVPAGTATLGLDRADLFGWDNERRAHRVEVPAFAIDALPVTNGQYLDFVRAGGYLDRSLWSDEDRAWLARTGGEHPHAWRRNGDGFAVRRAFGEAPLALDEPVAVTHAEASAYARFRGRALPSEAEWHRAAYGTPEGQERAYPWGQAEPGSRHGAFDAAHWDPPPVGRHPQGRSAFGVEDLVGGLWEWTSTPFAPFPGFSPFPFYPGYSADFFEGRHFVLKGGSIRTRSVFLRRSFRNWFQPHHPYVLAGFRCVDR